MSYILEALKKAQAERQLGSAPTIHAPAAHAVPAPAGQRKPLALGVAAGIAMAAVAAVVAWQQAGTRGVVSGGEPAQQLAAAPARAPLAAAPAEAKPAASPVVALVGVPDPTPKTPPAANREAVPAAAPDPAAGRAPAVVAPAPTQAAPPSPPAQVAAAPALATAADDSLPVFNALPEAVRSQVPRVAFGGYIYSPNPADRLLLIDKILRREGEEVAPGLVLEKLLPKAAVMNFRGFRYRVPY